MATISPPKRKSAVMAYFWIAVVIGFVLLTTEIGIAKLLNDNPVLQVLAVIIGLIFLVRVLK